MKKYKILKTFDGAENGIHTKTYKEGEILELGKGIGPEMVKAGTKAGWVEEVKGSKEQAQAAPTAPAPSTRGQRGAPNNKAAAPAEDKAAE